VNSARDRVGQFDAAVADVELVRIVGRVALRAAPEDPRALSQPRFDAFVGAHRDEFPGVPTARAIYMRVNSGNQGRVPWRQIVSAGLHGEAAARQTVVSGTRSLAEIGVDDHVVFFALNLTHGHHDASAGPFGEQVYETIRERLIGRGRSRNRELERVLPTAAQIVQRVPGGWPGALRVAGLATFPTDQRTTAAAEETGATATAPTGPSDPQPRAPRTTWSMTLRDAISLFLESNGRLPVKRELEQFAKLTGFPLQHPTRRWTDHITEFREHWAAQGRYCPPTFLPRQQRPELIIPASGDARRPRRGDWTDPDACARALNVFWDTLPRRREPTQKAYGRWAVGKPYPAPRAFVQHGGFGAVKERARELRQASSGQ
jgi:hypothetical protein